jgi:acid stress-induced BolA-like protein IbaG/YrbA
MGIYYMQNLEDLIHKLIDKHLDCDFLEVTGDGQHFEAIVVSDTFEGESRINRHRIIYKALGDRMKGEIHALSMKLYTKSEWENLNG